MLKEVEVMENELIENCVFFFLQRFSFIVLEKNVGKLQLEVETYNKFLADFLQWWENRIRVNKTCMARGQ